MPRLPRDAWIVLSGDALSAVGSGLTMPFLLVYLTQVRGVPVGVAGAAVATIALASLPGNPVGGWLADRYGPRLAVAVGLACTATGTAALAVVQRQWHAFAAVAVLGFGNAVTLPALDSLLATVVPAARRSEAFSVRYATFNAGLATGGLLAATFVDVGSPATFVTIYLVDAATCLAFVPALLAVHPSRPVAPPDQGSAGGFRVVLRDRVFVRIWLLMALLVTIGYAQMYSGFPGYAAGPGGITAGQLGLVMAANTLAVVGGQLLVLRAMSGRRRTTALLWVCATWAAAWTAALVAGQLDGATAVVGFAVSMALFGIGETFLSPVVPAVVNDLAPEHLRGRYNGTFVLAMTSGFLVGPLLAGGALGAGGGDVLFAGLVCACGVAAVVGWRLRRVLPPGADVIGGQAGAAAEPVPEAAR